MSFWFSSRARPLRLAFSRHFVLLSIARALFLFSHKIFFFGRDETIIIATMTKCHLHHKSYIKPVNR
jgi:hypothetical protein